MPGRKVLRGCTSGNAWMDQRASEGIRRQADTLPYSPSENFAKGVWSSRSCRCVSLHGRFGEVEVRGSLSDAGPVLDRLGPKVLLEAAWLP